MKLIRLVCLSMLMSTSVFASQDIAVVGSITRVVKAPANGFVKASSSLKKIALLKLQLSGKARQTIANRTQIALSQQQPISTATQDRQSVQLGMNNVPVLDQGIHGTCATFANVAAIDAALNKGDYVSELCSLQLGRYLENNAYGVSGWDGSWGPLVLNQMSLFGIVSKDQQRSHGCGSLTEYPTYGQEPDQEDEISIVDYHQISEPLSSMYQDIGWSPILDVEQMFIDRDVKGVLDRVKASLNARDRVTFGVFVPDSDLGTVGAVGRHHAINDTWVLTAEVIKDVVLSPAGHEMVITGYNNDAVAVDDQGHEHRGLLTLRNSWGEGIGDKGNFYMSYDYFNALVIEAQRIRASGNPF